MKCLNCDGDGERGDGYPGRVDVECPDCGGTGEVCECGGALVYEAEIAAPGYGQSWTCTADGCGSYYTKIGRTFRRVDPSEPPVELTEEDVR